jgi:hypothetical protein
MSDTCDDPEDDWRYWWNLSEGLLEGREDRDEQPDDPDHEIAADEEVRQADAYAEWLAKTKGPSKPYPLRVDDSDRFAGWEGAFPSFEE